MAMASMLATDVTDRIESKSKCRDENEARQLFAARKMSFNQDDDQCHQSDDGSNEENGGSSCSHSSASSLGDASEEEEDEDGILANLYDDDEDQEKDSCGPGQGSNEPMEEGSDSCKSSDKLGKETKNWTFNDYIEMIEQDNQEIINSLSEEE